MNAFGEAICGWYSMPPTYAGTRFINEIPVVIFQDENPFSSRRSYDETLFNVCISLPKDGQRMPLYRGVEPEALHRVLQRGIDVLPTNCPIWANTLEKALEYGRLVLVLDSSHLRRSFAVLAEDSDAEALANAEAEFGTEYDELTGGCRYYSRWPRGHTDRNPAYEQEHGFYIPGDPFAALMGLLYFAGGNAQGS